jgi:hypothetical protein
VPRQVAQDSFAPSGAGPRARRTLSGVLVGLDRWPSAAVLAVAIAGCVHNGGQGVGARAMPTPSLQVGACGEPDRDGVMSAHPRLERADRDLGGDPRPETIVVDRAACTADGNCYWNVFIPPRTGTTDCPRFAGTFAGAALEPLATRGDDGMIDVRGYWNLHGGRLLLQSYRFMRGGYQVADVLLCKREHDDKLECADSN